MKVLLVCDDPVSLGAASVRVRAFVRSLSLFRHDITMVTSATVPASDEIREHCVNIVSLPFRRPAKRLERLFQNLRSLPDPMAPWARRAASDREVRYHAARSDLVLVSSPPHGIQLLGMLLHRRLGLPYVADLRDDWVGNHRARLLTPFHRISAARAEAKMVTDSSLIFANTSRMRLQFLNRHPDALAKVEVLTNGYNESEFRGLSSASKVQACTRIGYLGSDYAGHVPRVLEAMSKEWTASGRANCWQIDAHIGLGHEPMQSRSSLVKRHAWLSPTESAIAMNESDVLLLLMPPGEREPSPTVPLKTYAYLRTGLPIVYSGERGATTDLLDQFEGTHCLPRCGGGALARFFDKHADSWGKRHHRSDISLYNFESIGHRLEQRLRSLLESRHESQIGTSTGDE